MGVEGLDVFLQNIGRARHEMQQLRQDMLQSDVAMKGVAGHAPGMRRISDATLENARAQRQFRGELVETESAASRLKGHLGGIAGAVGGAVIAYAGWETVRKATEEGLANMKAMGGLSAIWEGPKTGIKALGEEFDKLARKVGIADEVLATAATDALRLGVDQKHLAGFMEVSGKTAAGTFGQYGDISAIIRATTNTANTYGMPLTPENASRIQNILWKGVAGGAGSFEDLGSFIGLRGKGMEALGVGIEDVPALLATLGKGGLRGQRALGTVQAMLDAMQTPSDQATATAESLGLPWDMKSVRTLGLGPWLQTMDQTLKSQGGDTSQILARLGVNPMMSNALLTLMANAGNFTALSTSMRGGGDLLGPQFAEWEKNPVALSARLGVTKDQGLESLGLGIFEGMAGKDFNAGVDKLADIQPKLSAFGELLGAGAGKLLDAAMLMSGVKIGADGRPMNAEGTNWAGYGIGAGAAGVGAYALSRTSLAQGAYGLLKNGWGAARSFLGGSPGQMIIDAETGLAQAVGGRAPLADRLMSSSGRFLQDEAGGFASRGGWGIRTLRGLLNGLVPGALMAASGEAAGAMDPSLMRAGLMSEGNAWTMRGDNRAHFLQEQADIEARYSDLITRNWTGMLQGITDQIEFAFRPTFTIFDRLREKADEVAMRKEDEKVLSIDVNLDHRQDIHFGDKSDDKTGVKAQKAGAGRAEVHVNYRYFQVTNGTGVHAVKPLPENVVFAHVRKGYD